MKEEITEVNGRMVTHKDVIHHTTTTVFGFFDRIKILFGRKVFITSQIYTMNDTCEVICSKAHTVVEKIFKNKSTGQGLMQSEPIPEYSEA